MGAMFEIFMAAADLSKNKFMHFCLGVLCNAKKKIRKQNSDTTK